MTDSWMIKYLAEGIGTMLLVLIGNGTIAAVTLKGSKNNGMGGLSIAWGYGIALMFPVLVFANVSGAHVNPALTLGLASAGLFPWAHVAQYILAQLIGAIVGQLLVVAIYNQYYLKTNDGAIALGTFATTNALEEDGHTKAMINGFINEAIGTFALVFGIIGFTTNFFGAESIKWYMQAAAKQGANTSSPDVMSQIWASVSGASASKMVGALAIGLLLVGLITCFGGPTGAALNPARDLGPRLVYMVMPQRVVGEKTDSKWWYAWVPVVAPIVGGVIAATVFKLMFK